MEKHSNINIQVAKKNLKKKHKINEVQEELLRDFGIDPYPRLKYFITPDDLWNKFVEYIQHQVDNTKGHELAENDPTYLFTITGFASYAGVSIDYIKLLKTGAKDLQELTREQVAQKIKDYSSYNEFIKIEGKFVSPGNNFSDVMNKILLAIENNLINNSLINNKFYLVSEDRIGTYKPYDTKSIGFILKNHFGYSEKIEQEVNNTNRITIINNGKKFNEIKNAITLNEDKAPEGVIEMDGNDIDVSFLLGD